MFWIFVWMSVGERVELGPTMAKAPEKAAAVHDLHHRHLHFEGGTLDS